MQEEQGTHFDCSVQAILLALSNKFICPIKYYVLSLKGGACGSIKEKVCLKEHLPFIKCECGRELLLIANLELMSEAIEAHISEHALTETNKATAQANSERIRDLLIRQVLEKASQIG